MLILAAPGPHAEPVAACPFCTLLRPTLAEQRDRAGFAFLAELISRDAAKCKVRVRHAISGGEHFSRNRELNLNAAIEGDTSLRPGTLLLVLGDGKAESDATGFACRAIPLNEVSYAYIARSPPFKTPTAERLPFFLDYLEHADPLLAEDAYLEFGHAKLDELAKFAERLPVDRLRSWVLDEQISPDRQGLYGLLLGLAASAQGRDDVAADFWRRIAAPASDFRSGFDGILGGYLWLAKGAALRRLEERYLGDQAAAVGDLRHFMTALRVCHDFGCEIPRDELLRVYRRLLEKPALAAAAVDDLRRWRDWPALDQVASLLGRPGYQQAATERAAISYLLACPLETAQRQVARLRQLLPQRVAEAEQNVASETSRE